VGGDTVVRDLTRQVLARECNANVLSIENNTPNFGGPALEFLPNGRQGVVATLNDWKTSKGTDPVEAADPLPVSVDTWALRFKQNSDAFSIVSSIFRMRVDNCFKSSINSVILPVPPMATS